MTIVMEPELQRLGAAVRARRRMLGLTLVEVAGRAELSHPFLSQFERGLARPSMRSLTAIAVALETTAQGLLAVADATDAESRGPLSIVRADSDATSIDSPGGTIRALVHGERSMLPVEYRGAPKQFHEYFSHIGEEFVYIVSGTIEIDLEGELDVLHEGDAVYYAGGLRHRWRSIGRKAVRLVVVQQNYSDPH